MKYYVMPFGCQMNQSDTERIRTVLNGMGYTESDDENDPEVVLKGIVACSVRQKAIDRVYGRIRNWNASKVKRPVLTFISGCILPSDREKFLKVFDLVFPIDQLPLLPDMIRQYGVPTPGSLPYEIGAPEQGEPGREDARKRIEDFWKLKPSYTSQIEAFVPIQNGCDKFCSFCAVPYTRGREVSRPSSDILQEVRGLVEKGCRSITLLGQNVNSYGLDKKGKELSFPQLMRAVGEIGRENKADFWTFFTSPHPRDITTELLEVIAEYPVLAKWIHLPLQSGDD
ncbi:MAG: radical SAM protein, partial [Spirochaetaceae bacterium]|nr:radical SAM protein [Spirochaetaceae bacterium]